MIETVEPFRFCPRCGSCRLRASSPKSVACDDCGFEYYLNPAAAVAGLIAKEDGKLLLTVRGREPAKGTLDLPGGFVDPGESAEEALRREIKEELDLDILSMTYLCSVPNTYFYGGVLYHTVDLAYLCRVQDAQTAKARDDVSSVFFQSPTEIDVASFGLPSIRAIVSRYIWSLRRDP